ncbi:MAG: ATP-binding cassette domain-containing protein [Spirochaetales bacterium]|nr:ATP-binding cassette domain-containing protein [Spirochaetales bacterium]
MIELENLSKTFKIKDGLVKALVDVSLSINEGERYGVIGYSGAGKSTLVRCINFLEMPDSGSVTIDGKRMEIENGVLYSLKNGEKKKMSEKELNKMRSSIGMIFQHFNLLDRSTVFENIAYPLKYTGKSKKEISDKVFNLLELVGLVDKANAYPSQLSGGQKQRVAIARALANDPKILLSDEATSALDPDATESIIKLLKDLNKKLGITVVLITHEMSVIKSFCERVAVMEDGKVVEEGRVQEIFASPQAPITKRFVSSTSSLSKIKDLIKADSPLIKPQEGESDLYKLVFDTKVNSPVISEVSRKFDVDFNIILANVEVVADATIGAMIVKIRGEESAIKAALDFLKESNIRIEEVPGV